MRTTVPERYAQPLGRPDRNVRPELGRRAEQREGEQIRRHHHERTVLLAVLRHLLKVLHVTERVRVLHQHARDFMVAEVDLLHRAEHDLDAERFQARLYHRNRLRVELAR